MGTNDKRLSADAVEYIASQLPKYYTENEDGCHVWQGYRAHGNLPALVVRYNGKRVSAMVKRFVYAQANPLEHIGLKAAIHNTCGNPDCVNPAHLALGAGIGSTGFEQMKLVLRTWYVLNQEKVPTQDIAKQVGVCYPTLKRYIKLFEQQPEAWLKLWNKQY